MKKQAVIIILVSLVLTACNQNKSSDKTPVVGEAVDSVAIANDTVQQENIEGSYEYAQTIIVSPKLVYDIRAYGGPVSRGEYCILRRGTDNKTDTVVQGERTGPIVTAFTVDLNHNGLEEIYVVFSNPNLQSSVGMVGFEFDKNGAKTAIDFGSIRSGTPTINDQERSDCILPLNDSIYLLDGGLVRVSAYKNKRQPNQYMYRQFKLKGTKLEFEKSYIINKNQVK